MNFQGINFNKKYWKGKKLEDFIKQESHHGLSKKQLEEAHELLQAKEPKEAEAENPESFAKDQPVDTGKAGKTA